jgi:hypothetical protein
MHGLLQQCCCWRICMHGAAAPVLLLVRLPCLFAAL